jgi:hypothetical protein
MEPISWDLAMRLLSPEERSLRERQRRAGEDEYAAQIPGAEPWHRYKARKLAEKLAATAAKEPERRQAQAEFDCALARLRSLVRAGRLSKAEASRQGQEALKKFERVWS